MTTRVLSEAGTEAYHVHRMGRDARAKTIQRILDQQAAADRLLFLRLAETEAVDLATNDLVVDDSQLDGFGVVLLMVTHRPRATHSATQEMVGHTT